MGRRKHALLRSLVPLVLVFCAVLVVFAAAVGRTDRENQAEELRLAGESVRRAAVACYAAEGFYPDTYEYLRDNYHVRIDETKFAVEYEAFASNLMPEITIVEVSR